MNEAKVYADGFHKSFVRQEDFLEFLRGIGKNSSWVRKRTKDLRLAVMEKGSKMEDAMKAAYIIGGMEEDIIDDTIQSTGLVLKVKGLSYPVRDCAVNTILNRAAISGNALKKVERNVYARIINECLKVAKGEALLRLSEGKVSAVLGGDCQDYAVLDMEQVFLHAVQYLNQNFCGCTYLGGFYEHHMASALWELSGEDKLLEAYREELMLHDRNAEEMKPVVRITTSDTGDSGVNIYPMLLSGNRNDTIALGNPIRLKHKAGASMAGFDSNLQLIYGKYEVAIRGLSELLRIAILNPVNCMMGITRHLGISQKCRMEAVELFKAQYGEEPCTAHDIYYGISEILYMMACDGAEGSRITKMEETIARALSVDWKEFDVPGNIKW